MNIPYAAPPIVPVPPVGRDPVNQSALFQRLRGRLLQNQVRGVQHVSLMRFLSILLCSLLIWAAIFGVFAEGFSYLNKQRIPLTGGIVGTIFDFLFLSLSVLLLFSNGIILYSSLFSGPETAFLLSGPARADQVFAYKFQGAVLFSSWGFLLLGSPILIAYGLAFSVPWYFYVFLPLFFIGFVLLPGALGALVCLLVANWLPRHFRQIWIAFALILASCLGWWLYSIKPSNWNEALNRDFVQRLVGQFALAQGPLSPNHWLARGLQAAARGDASQALYYLALVWSNGLFLYVVMTWSAARWYRRGYNLIATGGSLRRRYGGSWLDRTLTGLVAFLDPQTRLLIVKDFRMFRRDPSQWAQVLIFCGLMVLYFANMRRFYQEDIGLAYQNWVSLMNLAATALLLCAYTGRFIFPMLSLEGRKFWVLGLLPLRRDRLVWGKFAFSATWSLLIAEFLVIFSDFMLGMPAIITSIHALTVAVLALGLSGLSVGLGAWMPNFRETDSSKIAVGFGGTLNLIVSLLFLLVEVALMAGPWHLRQAWSDRPQSSPADIVWPILGTVAGLVLGLVAVGLPLRVGARSLRQMEF
jgi:ABC-2 type transport system permease protein